MLLELGIIISEFGLSDFTLNSNQSGVLNSEKTKSFVGDIVLDLENVVKLQYFTWGLGAL